MKIIDKYIYKTLILPSIFGISIFTFILIINVFIEIMEKLFSNDLPALSASGTAAASYCMAYGKPYAYQLDLFGPYSVEVSRDYKFAEGLLAVMGEAMIGGNVVTENGFIRVKKA